MTLFSTPVFPRGAGNTGQYYRVAGTPRKRATQGEARLPVFFGLLVFQSKKFSRETSAQGKEARPDRREELHEDPDASKTRPVVSGKKHTGTSKEGAEYRS